MLREIFVLQVNMTSSLSLSAAQLLSDLLFLRNHSPPNIPPHSITHTLSLKIHTHPPFIRKGK